VRGGGRRRLVPDQFSLDLRTGPLVASRAGARSRIRASRAHQPFQLRVSRLSPAVYLVALRFGRVLPLDARRQRGDPGGAGAPAGRDALADRPRLSRARVGCGRARRVRFRLADSRAARAAATARVLVCRHGGVRVADRARAGGGFRAAAPLGPAPGGDLGQRARRVRLRRGRRRSVRRLRMDPAAHAASRGGSESDRHRDARAGLHHAQSLRLRAAALHVRELVRAAGDQHRGAAAAVPAELPRPRRSGCSACSGSATCASRRCCCWSRRRWSRAASTSSGRSASIAAPWR
jgi:hypothetical protein